MYSVQLCLSSFIVRLLVTVNQDTVRLSLPTATYTLSSYLCPLLQSVYLSPSIKILLDYLCPLPHVLCPVISVLFYSPFTSHCHTIHCLIIFGHCHMYTFQLSLSSFTVRLPVTVNQDTVNYLCPLPHILCPVISVLFYSPFTCPCHTRHSLIIFVHCHIYSVQLSLSSFSVRLPVTVTQYTL